MKNLIRRLLGYKERRTQDLPVSDDRRKRKTIKEADQSLDNALDRLDQTMRMKRADFIREERVVAVNDSQQTVIFSTFREICRFRGSEALKVTLCRHRRHEDAANSALAVCEEGKCPLILEALKGAA